MAIANTPSKRNSRRLRSTSREVERHTAFHSRALFHLGPPPLILLSLPQTFRAHGRCSPEGRPATLPRACTPRAG